MKTFTQVLNQIRREALSEQEKGARFEQLMQAFLKTYPLYASIFEEVWLWNEFPYRKKLGGHDLGIDIVCKTLGEEYWAVQCKCYAEDNQIDKPEVDSFISNSSRTFSVEDGKEGCFSQRLWISTTNNWNVNAEETLKNQYPPIIRLNLSELEAAEVDWEKLADGLFGADYQSPRFSLRDHQKKALKNAHAYYQEHDRGKLIMACGTGKTFTSLRIVEQETQSKGLVLYLVPSIALLGQTLRAWFDQAQKPMAAVCVCSDAGVSQGVRGKRKKGEEEYDRKDNLVDLAYPATTKAAAIVSHLEAIHKRKRTGLTVVFSTYQSLEAVAMAQQQLLEDSEGEWGVFDFVVCDEAHRTTGVTLKDEEESQFVKIHDNDFIQAKKRMYMTATPRIYTEGAIQKARIVSATLCSMDDETLYGQEFYRIGFGEAVEKQLLTDYKVLVITLCKDDISLELASCISEKDISESDAAKFAGCIAAISKRVIGDEGMLMDVDPQPMRRAVSFCNSIKNSQLITRVFNECREAYTDEQKELMMVESHHVDGTMSAPRRDKELSWLKEMPANSNECRMLTNAKCLSEGVDVPSLDAVLFLSSRDSQVDVVQSVGRVMRAAEGKKYGYIIIPVVVPEEEEANNALDRNEAFKVVWTVLNALRAHDDRFNAEINKIDLGSHSKRIIVTHPFNRNRTDNSDADEGPDRGQTADGDAVSTALAHFGEFQKAFYGKLVIKCGSKHYLEDWAKDVAEMSERRIKRIREVIATDEEKKDFFNDLLKQMRQNINPTLTENSFIEMLGQHFVSAPVFESLFGNQQFVESNPVSQVLQAAVELLAEDDMTEEEKEKIAAMRKDVQQRVEGVTDAAGRQRIIKELYEKFFAVAAKSATEQLGIVYTPIPVVDFIVHSVGYIVQKEFGRSLSDENVHILDPFTGTGTFISRLLQSGLIRKEDLPRKYGHEIHANEIVLLAYYIASINIETVYHSLFHDEEKEEGDYKDFQGICLTDTFQLGEPGSEGTIYAKDFEINSQRLIDQRNTPLTVIMGNPPYSVGQKNANDNAQNTHYKHLEKKIAATYVAGTKATMKGALYDSYIKAFRWATDRLGKEGGVIGFVTNGGWIDGNAMDGMRKCFEKDFSAIYVFNLRGNCNTSGELRKKEGGGIFGQGSRTPIAITILVKKPHSDNQQKARIYYHDIGDYLSTQQKFDIINQFHDISNIPWTSIQPDKFGDWINLRNELFANFTILGDKKDKKAVTFFLPNYSNGLKTNRDAWAYNSSQEVVQQRAKEQIDYYNQTLEELNNGQRQALDFETNKISWTANVQNDILKRHKHYDIAEATYREVMYRPFCKQQLLYYAPLNERQCQIPSIFPTPQHKNLVICTPSIGNKKEFSCLMVDCTPDLHFIDASQCFPLYYYDNGVQEGDTLFTKAETRDEWGYVKKNCLTNEIYVQARHLYGKEVTREDIFYYIYGILHNTQYRKEFADDLKKSLPRIPLIEDKELFHAYSQAGRQLADLHLHYEQVEPYKGCITLFGAYGLAGNEQADYRVKKMRFGKTKDNETDKTVIIYNDGIRIEDIPLKAYNYVVNGQSAIEWLMERYAYTIDTKTGFVNDPNDWGAEHNDPKYIYNLLLRMINVSLQTQEIVANLPNLDIK